jgi:hypothetical protein
MTLVEWSNGGLRDEPCAPLRVPSLGQTLDKLSSVVYEVVPVHAILVLTVPLEVGEAAVHSQPRGLHGETVGPSKKQQVVVFIFNHKASVVFAPF